MLLLRTLYTKKRFLRKGNSSMTSYWITSATFLINSRPSSGFWNLLYNVVRPIPNLWASLASRMPLDLTAAFAANPLCCLLSFITINEKSKIPSELTYKYAIFFQKLTYFD